MVDVTTEALKMVKDSLSNFLTDVEGVASRADNRSSEIVNSCRTQVNQAKNDVSQSEARITALTNEISQAEEKIQSTTNEISSITTRILASVLDEHMCSAPENGLLKALYATHPHSDDRIARLQELGAEYSRY